jgi:hypothetical protein
MVPKPPSSETAAARGKSDTPMPIPPWIIGTFNLFPFMVSGGKTDWNNIRTPSNYDAWALKLRNPE